MPTEKEELGKIYYYDPRTEEWIPFGGVKEVHLTCEDEADDPFESPITLDHEIRINHFKVELSRKSKRRLNRAFGIPDYKITEWCFPKKKKRGTIRRKRKERKEK